MIKIKDSLNRDNLIEGRNFQLGFAFLKRLPQKDNYQTVQPISACKDYLNDVVWAGATRNSIAAYGLAYKKNDIFIHRYGYMAYKILPYKSGQVYPTMEADKTNLKENYRNMQVFINQAEEMLKLPQRTRIRPTLDPDTFFIRVPLQWTKYTYLISLYSFLIRIGQYYKEGGIIEYLDGYNRSSGTHPSYEDSYLWNTMKPKFMKLIERTGDFPVQDLPNMFPDDLRRCEKIHNYGIVNCKELA